MTFRFLMTAAAIILITFGVYLIVYGSFVLWDYHRLLIPEAIERDAHGMSRLVGYTFILLVGVMCFGLGLLSWFTKGITDPRAQQALTLGLVTVNGFAFLLSLFCQIQYWASKWGQLYVTTFLLLVVVFGYVAFFRKN